MESISDMFWLVLFSKWKDDPHVENKLRNNTVSNRRKFFIPNVDQLRHKLRQFCMVQCWRNNYCTVCRKYNCCTLSNVWVSIPKPGIYRNKIAQMMMWYKLSNFDRKDVIIWGKNVIKYQADIPTYPLF